MKKAMTIVTVFPLFVHATDAATMSTNLLISWAPVLLLMFILWLVIRLIFANAKRTNERLVASNERMAKSLEELVTVLRKKE